MNCLLIGLGSYAKRIYLEFLRTEEYIEKTIIVDLLSEKENLEAFLQTTNLNYELVLLNNVIRNSKALPKECEALLKEVVDTHNIKKVI